MEFNEKIFELRKKNGLSQEALAEKLGVSRQSVSKWETGEAMPETDKIIMISEVFAVSIDYLLKSEKTEEKTQTEAQNQTFSNDIPYNLRPRRGNFLIHMIDKYGHIAGYYIALQGLIGIIISRAFAVIAKSMLPDFSSNGFLPPVDGFGQTSFMQSSSSAIVAFSWLITIVAASYMLFGLGLAFYLKRRNKDK